MVLFDIWLLVRVFSKLPRQFRRRRMSKRITNRSKGVEDELLGHDTLKVGKMQVNIPRIGTQIALAYQPSGAFIEKCGICANNMALDTLIGKQLPAVNDIERA